ncbi:MAG: hypothetical protein ACJAVV_002835 [Alphaproteobacteria bacterium]|jgi:hypothetical protein
MLVPCIKAGEYGEMPNLCAYALSRRARARICKIEEDKVSYTALFPK